MTETEFTDEQIIQGIAIALKKKHFKIVPDLLHVLALQAPEKAQVIIDEIKKAAGER